MQRSLSAGLGWGVVLSFLAVFGAVGGCSADSFTTAAVTGKVTVDDKPMAGIMLEFEPERTGNEILPTAYGMTDAEGRYEVSRVGDPGGKPGAVIGMNTVRLSATEGSGSKIHPYYSDQGAFQREVVEGDNVLDFEIESRPAAARRGR